MPTEISAEFETPDMADFALATLRRNNVDIHSYTIHPIRQLNRRQESYPLGATNLWNGGFGNAVTADGDDVSYEQPKDVLLATIVPDETADYARELLRGAHGLRIR